MLIEEFIIKTYLIVDIFVKKYGRLRKRGPAPLLSDAEVIAMELVGEFLGHGSDKAIFDYFKHHWLEWFPNLGSRKSFVTQSANLWRIKELLRESLLKEIKQAQSTLFLSDGFPIPTCHPKRVRNKNPLRADAAFGYCAAKELYYYGMKGHLLTDENGLILNYSITAANIDERDVLPELSEGNQGHLIADKGLIGKNLTECLAEQGIHLHTPLRSNMKDSRPKSLVNNMMNIRRKIETVIGQLTKRFCIQSIRAKDIFHLCMKITRKILAHNLAWFYAGSLQFDSILS